MQSKKLLVYVGTVIALCIPAILIRVFPEEGSSIRAIASLTILTLICLFFICAALPVVRMLVAKAGEFGKREIFYALLRTLIAVAGIYMLFALVAPTWRGFVAVYLLGQPQQEIHATILDQGSSLSFVPLVGSLKIEGQRNDLIWFYGAYLTPGADYEIDTLPGSPVVIGVK